MNTTGSIILKIFLITLMICILIWGVCGSIDLNVGSTVTQRQLFALTNHTDRSEILFSNKSDQFGHIDNSGFIYSTLGYRDRHDLSLFKTNKDGCYQSYDFIKWNNKTLKSRYPGSRIQLYVQSSKGQTTYLLTGWLYERTRWCYSKYVIDHDDARNIVNIDVSMISLFCMMVLEIIVGLFVLAVWTTNRVIKAINNRRLASKS